MKSQTRTAAVLVSVLIGAALAAISAPSLLPVPVTPPRAQAGATSGLESSQPVMVEFAELGTSEATEARAAPQRTLAEADASGRRPSIREQDDLRRRIAAAAKKLDLSAADEDELLEVLLDEQARRAEAIRLLGSNPGDAAVHVHLRAELDAILAWKTKELRTRFGPARADILMRR